MYGTADAPGATRIRCVVHVRVDTRRIRALFDSEKPPVSGDEWDEAEYVAQRLRAYRDALDPTAAVQAVRPDEDDDAAIRDDDPAIRDGDDPAARDDEGGRAPDFTSASCPRTGDRVRIELGGADTLERDALRADVERALQRVFADAHAWRRQLLPTYFERHRRWRAVNGGPIQH